MRDVAEVAPGFDIVYARFKGLRSVCLEETRSCGVGVGTEDKSCEAGSKAEGNS